MLLVVLVFPDGGRIPSRAIAFFENLSAGEANVFEVACVQAGQVLALTRDLDEALDNGEKTGALCGGDCGGGCVNVGHLGHPQVFVSVCVCLLEEHCPKRRNTYVAQVT